MGVGGLLNNVSSSSFDVVKESSRPIVANPDPGNYEILASESVGDYLIMRIKYLDCVNYEGVKILMFRGCTLDMLNVQKLIDPHFSDNDKMHSPIARFEPTKRGWNMAYRLAVYYTGIDNV